MGRRSPESDLPHMHLWGNSVYVDICLIVEFLFSDTSDGKKEKNKTRKKCILDSLQKVLINKKSL